MMPAAFASFVKKAPLCVMSRIALEGLFDSERLDQLFERTAQRQYHRELLFSQVRLDSSGPQSSLGQE